MTKKYVRSLDTLWDKVEKDPAEAEAFVDRWTPWLAEDHCSIHLPSSWIEPVHQALMAIVEICPGFKIIQIKEKFNGLRIYHSVPQTTTIPHQAIVEMLVTWAEDRVRDIEEESS